MDLDQDGVMMYVFSGTDSRGLTHSIHMGGVYGDKPSTLERFKTNYPRLSEKVKRRLVLENDEVRQTVPKFPIDNRYVIMLTTSFLFVMS